MTAPKTEDEKMARKGGAKPDGDETAPEKKGDDAASGDKSAAAQRKPGGSGRRAPGAKEVIPFAWKLVGTSGDLTVTLFKAVEKPDVDAQLERLQKDGYYKNLQVMEVDAVVVQPEPAKKPARGKGGGKSAGAESEEPGASASAGKRAASTKAKRSRKKSASTSPASKPKKKKKKAPSATKKKR